MANINILTMKSKKAEEFNPNTEKNRQLLISAIKRDEKACKKLKYIIGLPDEKNIDTVESGEEKMRGKAIKAFCQTVCGGLGEDCKSCKIVKTFIKKLNSNV